jgi:uncharacterized protein
MIGYHRGKVWVMAGTSRLPAPTAHHTASGAIATMARATSPAVPVDLGPLDAFLMSDRAPENGMGLSDLDGFLTGIVVGPELIMPSEWLPLIWGGDEPKFVDIDEAKTVLGTIMGRYNEIVATLDADPDSFDPVFWEGSEGQVIVTDWAAGFMDAVKLRPQAWEPLIQHKQARVLMVPLLVLGADDFDHPPFGMHPLPADEVEQLLEDGAEIIPEMVVGIHAFWREQKIQPTGRPARASRRTPTAKPSTAATTAHVLRVSLKARLYREIEIRSTASLHKLAEAIVAAFGFDFDHAFGFFSKFSGNIFNSSIRYELFAGMDGDTSSRSVKRTRIEQAFPHVGDKLLFLFDYGDEWRFMVEVTGIGKPEPNARYPRTISKVGEAPPQYDDPNEDA